jgi:predicted dehydrogenase
MTGSTFRRDFLRNSAAVVAAGGLSGSVASLARANPVHVANREVLKVGLVGCGGRGSGAAVNALMADPNTELVALGDTFQDHLQDALNSLKHNADVGARVKVTPDHCYVGFDSYKGVVDASDVVLLCTATHFRPQHMEYAVEKGKHLFVEKPVGSDAPGVRRVHAAGKKHAANGKNVVSGLCYRYQRAKQETMKRIHDGAVGEFITMQATYNAGNLWHRGRQPQWTEMEFQVRNWLYFTWLSGDHIAEQHIHSLDKLMWAMKDEVPVKAVSSGGRVQRTGAEYGNVYDHFNTVYEWKSGLKGFSSCRQWYGAATDVSDFVYGTKGRRGAAESLDQG